MKTLAIFGIVLSLFMTGFAVAGHMDNHGQVVYDDNGALIGELKSGSLDGDYTVWNDHSANNYVVTATVNGIEYVFTLHETGSGVKICGVDKVAPVTPVDPVDPVVPVDNNTTEPDEPAVPLYHFDNKATYTFNNGTHAIDVFFNNGDVDVFENSTWFRIGGGNMLRVIDAINGVFAFDWSDNYFVLGDLPVVPVDNNTTEPDEPVVDPVANNTTDPDEPVVPVTPVANNTTDVDPVTPVVENATEPVVINGSVVPVADADDDATPTVALPVAGNAIIIALIAIVIAVCGVCHGRRD